MISLKQNRSNVFQQDILTLPMLRLFLSKAQEHIDLLKPSKPCHVGIHWIALAENSYMSTHLPGFWSFFKFLHHFVLTNFATSSIRVDLHTCDGIYVCFVFCRYRKVGIAFTSFLIVGCMVAYGVIAKHYGLTPNAFVK